MRLTSEFWVSALVRNVNRQGAYAVIQKKGAAEAGAIFIVIDRLDGTGNLYAPAPQTEFDEASPSDRKFEKHKSEDSLINIDALLEKEMRFDPDLWIVVIEDREGREVIINHMS